MWSTVALGLRHPFRVGLGSAAPLVTDGLLIPGICPSYWGACVSRLFRDDLLTYRRQRHRLPKFTPPVPIAPRAVRL